MRGLRAAFLRLWGSFRRESSTHEIEEELDSHVQLHTDDNVRAGMTPEEARRRAMIALGGIEQTKELWREQRGLPWLEDIVREVRYSARRLLRTKGVSCACVLAIAVGVGMNVAVYSAVRGVLLEPIGFGEPDRLVVVWERSTRDEHPQEISFPNFLDWRAASDVLEDMAAMGSTFWGELRFVGPSEPFTGRQRAVSYSFFQTLGVEALEGRTFVPEDDEPGAPPVMVVSHRFWRSKLGEDPEVVGRRVSVRDGEPITVIGVMPPGFDYPMGTEVWTAIGPQLANVADRLGFTPTQERGLDVLFVIGRLAPGKSLSEADAEMTGILRTLHAEYRPEAAQSRTIRTQPLVEQFIGNARSALLALWGAVGLVLLLACTNVAVLLLVRESGRRKENALQLALGAGRTRILRQMTFDAAATVAAGGVLGWYLAHASLRLFIGMTPVDVPRLRDVALSSDAALFTVGLLVVVLACVVVLPAMRFSAPEISDTLVGSGRGEAVGHARFRGLLVAVQIALAFILLAGAGVMGKSFLNLVRLELGFDPANLLTFSVPLSDERFPTPEAKQRVNLELLTVLETIPGVAAVAGVQPRPFRGDSVGNDWGFYIEGQSREHQQQNPRASQRAVTTSYFRTMATRLLEGRTFTAADDERAAPVIIISKNFADQMWPGESAVGKRVCCRREQWLTVIGVVENTRSRDVYAPRLDLYTHYPQGFANLSAFLIRAHAEPLDLAVAVRGRVESLNADLFVEDITTMDAVMARVYAPWRFNMAGFGLFAAVALGLAAIGLFGLLAFNVRERTKEIGVRVALGASRSRIARMVMRQALTLVSAGCLAGIAASVLLTGLVRSLLFGAGATGVLTYVVVTVVLVLAASIAAYLPARYAANVDPAVSIRAE